MERLGFVLPVPQVGLHWVGLEQKVRAAGGHEFLGGNPALDLNTAQGGSSSSPPSDCATLEDDDGRA